MNVLVTDLDALLAQDNVDPGRLAEAILARHYATLHFLAYSILGDADEADDAVQDGLIAALDNIDRYRPGSNLKAWLATIVVNPQRQEVIMAIDHFTNFALIEAQQPATVFTPLIANGCAVGDRRSPAATACAAIEAGPTDPTSP